MKSKYVKYSGSNLTKELLLSLNIGDYIKFSGSNRGMKIYDISKNYILAETKIFKDKSIFSIIHKDPVPKLCKDYIRNVFIHETNRGIKPFYILYVKRQCG